MKNDNIPALKPCPFCGNKNVLLKKAYEAGACITPFESICPQHCFETNDCDEYIALCPTGRGGCGASSGLVESPERAAELWNNRKNVDADVLEKIDRITSNYTFGQQRKKLVEELAELIRAVSRFEACLEGGTYDYDEVFDNLNDEIADVYIMVEQMRTYIGRGHNDSYVEHKLDRQIERIKNERDK